MFPLHPMFTFFSYVIPFLAGDGFHDYIVYDIFKNIIKICRI